MRFIFKNTPLTPNDVNCYSSKFGKLRTNKHWLEVLHRETTHIGKKFYRGKPHTLVRGFTQGNRTL